MVSAVLQDDGIQSPFSYLLVALVSFCIVTFLGVQALQHVLSELGCTNLEASATMPVHD